MGSWKNEDEMFALMKDKLYTPVVRICSLSLVVRDFLKTRSDLEVPHEDVLSDNVYK